MSLLLALSSTTITKKSKNIMQFFVLFIVPIIVAINNNMILPFNPANAQKSINTDKSLAITHGIASGDITNHSAVIWSRANRESQMHVEYDTNSNFTRSRGSSQLGKEPSSTS